MKLLNEKASRGGSLGSSGSRGVFHCHGRSSLLVLVLLLAFFGSWERGIFTPWTLP